MGRLFFFFLSLSPVWASTSSLVFWRPVCGASGRNIFLLLSFFYALYSLRRRTPTPLAPLPRGFPWELTSTRRLLISAPSSRQHPPPLQVPFSYHKNFSLDREFGFFLSSKTSDPLFSEVLGGPGGPGKKVSLCGLRGKAFPPSLRGTSGRLPYSPWRRAR